MFKNFILKGNVIDLAVPKGQPEPSAEEKLLAEIRDLLKQKG